MQRAILKPQKKAYTLMELCVVLCVVALLLVMLPKAFAQVLASSSQIACMSSLDQLGGACFLYSENNNGFLPHEDFGSTEPPTDACWYQTLDSTISATPKAQVKQDPDSIELDKTLLEDTGFSYKMNSRLEDYKGHKATASPSFRSVASIPHPDKTVLFFDGDISKPSIFKLPYGMYLNVVNRHLSKSNLLLLDGQVKSSAGNSPEEHWKGAGGFLWDPDAAEDQQ